MPTPSPGMNSGSKKTLSNLQKMPSPASPAPQSLAKSGTCRKGARPMYRIARLEGKNRAFEEKRLDVCIFPRLAERDHGQSALSGSRYCFPRQAQFSFKCSIFCRLPARAMTFFSKQIPKTQAARLSLFWRILRLSAVHQSFLVKPPKTRKAPSQKTLKKMSVLRQAPSPPRGA